MKEPTRSESLAYYWREHIDAWRSGSDSQAAYCKAHDLVYHRFVYWRRRFETHTPAPGVPEFSGGFAKVTCEPEVDVGLTLTLPNGLVLQGISAANVSIVRRLLDQL